MNVSEQAYDMKCTIEGGYIPNSYLQQYFKNELNKAIENYRKSLNRTSDSELPLSTL